MWRLMGLASNIILNDHISELAIKGSTMVLNCPLFRSHAYLT